MKYHEGLIIQVIIYSGIWLLDEYTGLLICLILGLVIGALLLFSIVADKIEKSKVPSSYYKWMLLSSLTPLVIALIFTIIYSGNYDWLQK